MAAGAGPKDEEARKLGDQAIFTDYLATEFTAAQEKLVVALELCGTDQCSAPVVARLHRDLGVVLVAGLQDPENGKAELVLALQADPTITLDKDLTTPELDATFAQARQEVTGATGPAPAAQPPAGGQQGTKPPAKDQSLAELAGGGDSDEAICPPDFPGCSEDEGGFAGSFCDAASPCPEGYACADNTCDEVVNVTEEAQRKNWVGGGVQQDFLLLSQGEGLCLAGSDYGCFVQNSDAEYVNQNGAIYPAEAGRLSSTGMSMATTRILVSFDRSVTNNISVGARAGFAFGGGPQAKLAGGSAFVPIHLEGRGTLWFGTGVFNKKGFRPFVFVGGGMAQVDAKETVPVLGDKGEPLPPQERYVAFNVDAWRKTGLGFVTLGAGTAFAFTPAFYLSLEAKLMQLLPASGTALSGQLGAAYGF